MAQLIERFIGMGVGGEIRNVIGDGWGVGVYRQGFFQAPSYTTVFVSQTEFLKGRRSFLIPKT